MAPGNFTREPAPGAPLCTGAFDSAEESWLHLFARLGIGLSPELLDLGEPRRHDQTVPAVQAR